MVNAGRVLIIPRGDYSPSRTYEMLDLVSYEGSSYIAKETTTGNLPTDTAFWQLSAKGSNIVNTLSNFAPMETTSTASRPYNVDDFLVDEDGNLKRVIQGINASDPIIDGTNVEDTTVADIVEALEASVDKLTKETLRLTPSIEISESVSLNTLKDIGEYAKSATTFFVTDAPLGIDSIPNARFRLRVEKGSDGANRILQTLITDNNERYTRAYKGTTWTEWETPNTDHIFSGTQSDWDALSVFEQTSYKYAVISDN